jgi:hypothetical protein
LDNSAPDYSESVSVALGKLADLHKLSTSQIVDKIRSLRDDTIHYRILADKRLEDTLPLSFMTSILQGAEQILLAAASNSVKPKAYHARLNKTAEAQKLLDQTRFRHTQTGSFIVSVSCPINAVDTHSGTDPFVRKTTLLMQRALVDLVNAIEGDKLEDLVSRTKQDANPLLSSNFCEAVGRLFEENIQNSVEISFDWSAMVAPPKYESIRKPIRLQSDYFPRIQEIAQELKPQRDYQDDSFIGTIESLNGELGEDGRRAGEVTVALLLREGESVLAKVNLSADDYAKADKAHMTNGEYVRVTGRLHPGRQPRSLTDVAQFSVFDAGQPT